MEEVNVGQVLNEVAYRFFTGKHYKLARMQMDVLLEMYPMDQKIRFNAAKCCYYEGNYEQALDHIDMAIMIDETNIDYLREKSLYLLWSGRTEESLELLAGDHVGEIAVAELSPRVIELGADGEDDRSHRKGLLRTTAEDDLEIANETAHRHHLG